MSTKGLFVDRAMCPESYSIEMTGSSRKTWVSYYLSSAEWVNQLLQLLKVSVRVEQEINMCKLSFNEKHAVLEGTLLAT